MSAQDVGKTPFLYIESCNQAITSRAHTVLVVPRMEKKENGTNQQGRTTPVKIVR